MIFELFFFIAVIASSRRTEVDEGIGGRCELRAAARVGHQLTPLVRGMVHGSFGIAYFIKRLACFIQVTLESFASPRLIIASWTRAEMEQRAYRISVDSPASVPKVSIVTPGTHFIFHFKS